MKILDMFGAGLPVCAFDYGPGLRELIRPGENAVLFSTADELARHLSELLALSEEASGRRQTLREGVRLSTYTTWREGWEVEARAAFVAPSGRVRRLAPAGH